MKITVTARADGRFEVSEDGYVRWCGYSVETAHTLAAHLHEIHNPTLPANGALVAAISQRSALYMHAGARQAAATKLPPTPRGRLYAKE